MGLVAREALYPSWDLDIWLIKFSVAFPFSNSSLNCSEDEDDDTKGSIKYGIIRSRKIIHEARLFAFHFLGERWRR